MCVEIPKLSKQDIEAKSLEVLTNYNNEMLIHPQQVPIEEIIETFGIELDFKKIGVKDEVLGLTVFNDGYLNINDNSQEISMFFKENTIVIDEHLLNTSLEHRLRFTFAHELAHWLLHKKLFSNPEQIELDTPRELKIYCFKKCLSDFWKFEMLETNSNRDLLEWQANYMASTILMPKPTFISYYKQLLMEMNIRQNYLYYDKQPCNLKNYHYIIDKLSFIFNVSKETVHIRLYKLNLLIDNKNYYARV